MPRCGCLCGHRTVCEKTTSFLLASLRSRCLASSGSYSLTSVIQQRSQAPQRIPEYVCLAMLMQTQCVPSTWVRGFFDDSASHLSERCIAVLLAENKCGNLQCLIIRDLPKTCHVLTNCTMTRTNVLLWLATRIPIQIREKNLQTTPSHRVTVASNDADLLPSPSWTQQRLSSSPARRWHTDHHTSRSYPRGCRGTNGGTRNHKDATCPTDR